jgi:hypothetical protein
MRFPDRRQFFGRTIFFPSLVCKLYSQAEPMLAAQGGAARYDLLIRGGRVIDPSQALSVSADVAIQGRVARIGSNSAPRIA